VIAKLDRLTRSVGDWQTLIDRYFCEKAGRQTVQRGRLDRHAIGQRSHGVEHHLLYQPMGTRDGAPSGHAMRCGTRSARGNVSAGFASDSIWRPTAKRCWQTRPSKRQSR